MGTALEKISKPNTTSPKIIPAVSSDGWHQLKTGRLHEISKQDILVGTIREPDDGPKMRFGEISSGRHGKKKLHLTQTFHKVPGLAE